MPVVKSLISFRNIGHGLPMQLERDVDPYLSWPLTFLTSHAPDWHREQSGKQTPPLRTKGAPVVCSPKIPKIYRPTGPEGIVMSAYSIQKRAERAAIVREMGELLVKGTPAALSRRRELDDKQKELLTDIETSERREGYQLPGVNTEVERSLTPLDEQRSSPEYRKNFWTAMTRSPEQVTQEMRSGLLSNDGSAGYLIPIGFQRELETRLKSFAGLRQACRVISSATGATLNWPTVDDTTNTGEYLTEGNETQLDTNDPAFGNVAFSSYLVSSKTVTVSVQTATDAFEQIEGILADLFSIRLSRTTEPTYLTGSGSGQPNGLLTALAAANYTGGPTGSYVVLANGANANSGNSADTEINSIGTQDISNLIEALDPAYQAQASLMGNNLTWSKLRSQLDKYGRPVWQSSLASGEPDTVYGKKYYNNQQMALIGAGNISLIAGDFSRYVIRDVVGMTMVRFNELFMQYYKLGYQMFLRTDGQLLQPAAFAVLQHRNS
jgi:HK97 family phage major capsid protein